MFLTVPRLWTSRLSIYYVSDIDSVHLDIIYHVHYDPDPVHLDIIFDVSDIDSSHISNSI
jgi:hypothetical protein